MPYLILLIMVTFVKMLNRNQILLLGFMVWGLPRGYDKELQGREGLLRFWRFRMQGLRIAGCLELRMLALRFTCGEGSWVVPGAAISGVSTFVDFSG